MYTTCMHAHIHTYSAHMYSDTHEHTCTYTQVCTHMHTYTTHTRTHMHIHNRCTHTHKPMQLLRIYHTTACNSCHNSQLSLHQQNPILLIMCHNYHYVIIYRKLGRCKQKISYTWLSFTNHIKESFLAILIIIKHYTKCGTRKRLYDNITRSISKTSIIFHYVFIYSNIIY